MDFVWTCMDLNMNLFGFRMDLYVDFVWFCLDLFVYLHGFVCGFCMDLYMVFAWTHAVISVLGDITQISVDRNHAPLFSWRQALSGHVILLVFAFLSAIWGPPSRHMTVLPSKTAYIQDSEPRANNWSAAKAAQRSCSGGAARNKQTFSAPRSVGWDGAL